jgi:ribokinase
MIDLVIAGTVSIDSVKTPYGQAESVLGGSASYASLAASFFAKPGIVAIAGADLLQTDRASLEAHGVDLAGLHTGEKTFRWKGDYHGDMSEATTLKTELNSLLGFEPVVPESYRKAKYLFLANIDPVVQTKVLKQMKPDFVVIDTMNYWINDHRQNLLKTVKSADLLLLNSTEAKLLTKLNNLVAAGRKILQLGPRYVIIKKGEHGALLFSKESHFSAPAYPLELSLDPTGAGDSFGGGLIGYLAGVGSTTEKDLRRGIIYGTVVASFCAEAFGIKKLEKITRKEIEERYAIIKKIREF